jgi:hypothetical protein
MSEFELIDYCMSEETAELAQYLSLRRHARDIQDAFRKLSGRRRSQWVLITARWCNYPVVVGRTFKQRFDFNAGHLVSVFSCILGLDKRQKN